MNGGKYPGMPFNQQMSFPCELTLRELPEGLRLCRYPVREIEKLRAKRHHWTDLPIRRGEAPLPGINTDTLDIQTELDPGNAVELGLKINGQDISYAPVQRRLSALGRSAILEDGIGPLKLRILVDRTSIEVFANDGRISFTSCYLPDEQQRRISIHSAGGSGRFLSLTVHELRSIW